MTRTTEPGDKEDRIVVRCDAAFKERAKRVADRAFGRNVSEMTRRALEDLLARYEADEQDEAA